MLRVGLTGGLGSGKSTVAGLLRCFGAAVIEADELGRQMMEPGASLYQAIVEHFGPSVVREDGHLDRPRLSAMAFGEGRLEELNALVHPAVIAAQRQWMEALFRQDPATVAVVESALIFEVERDALLRGEQSGPRADWRRRFDRMIVVTAPEELRIARYLKRIAPAEGWNAEAHARAEADARRRLSHQIPDSEKTARADFTICNDRSLEELTGQTRRVWERLKAESNPLRAAGSLE